MAATTIELIWIKLLLDFVIDHSSSVFLFSNNQAAPHIAYNLIFHQRTKHIEIDCHFICDKVVDGSLKHLPVRSQHQLADVFTKRLPAFVLFPLLSRMAVKDLYSPFWGGFLQSISYS